MYVIKREVGEQIEVSGDGVTVIEVIANHKGIVSLAFDAPRDKIRIRRMETLKRRHPRLSDRAVRRINQKELPSWPAVTAAN